MKFGPEVDDALGGRLAGATHQLSPHCAAILRALLLNREPFRLYIGTATGLIRENQYELSFESAARDRIVERLQFLVQESFAEEKDLSKYLSGKSIRTHILRRTQCCVVLISETNRPTWQKSQLKAISFLPRLLPEIFAEKKISKTEYTLLEAASKADCKTIETLLEMLYKESDFCNERQKHLLHGIVSYRLNLELKRARTEAVNAEHNANISLQRYMEQTQAALQNSILAEEYERRIEATTPDVDQIMNYLNSNKAVSVNIEGNTMHLDVTGMLTNFDPDAYRAIRDKSFAHFRENIVGNTEDALLFFDALFLEESIKIMIGARYAIEPHIGVTGKKGYAIPGVIPNPHIQYHACLGQYRGDMQAALSKSDFVGLIALCIASGVSLNIPERPTCGRFIKDVTGGSQKAVLLPDGETVSYKKAVAWLKQQKGIGGETTDGETNPADGSGD